MVFMMHSIRNIGTLDVTSLVLNFLNRRGSVKEINHNFIVLIPKVKEANKMTEFRLLTYVISYTKSLQRP